MRRKLVEARRKFKDVYHKSLEELDLVHTLDSNFPGYSKILDSHKQCKNEITDAVINVVLTDSVSETYYYIDIVDKYRTIWKAVYSCYTEIHNTSQTNL